MRRWRAVIFDLDDTLYPEADYVLGGFRAVAQWAEEHLDIARETGYRELTAFFAAGVRGDTFNRWLAWHDASAALTPTLVAVYREHRPALTPFPGVLALLGWVRQHAALGLLGDGYLDVQERKVAALGIGPYFDAVVFSDVWGREGWKPSTRPFIAMRERLAIGDARAVYIGDNPTKDFHGARATGFDTIWLRHSGGDYTRLSPPDDDHRADTTVDSLAALRAVLRAQITGCCSGVRAVTVPSQSVPPVGRCGKSEA